MSIPTGTSIGAPLRRSIRILNFSSIHSPPVRQNLSLSLTGSADYCVTTLPSNQYGSDEEEENERNEGLVMKRHVRPASQHSTEKIAIKLLDAMFTPSPSHPTEGMVTVLQASLHTRFSPSFGFEGRPSSPNLEEDIRYPGHRSLIESSEGMLRVERQVKDTPRGEQPSTIVQGIGKGPDQPGSVVTSLRKFGGSENDGVESLDTSGTGVLPQDSLLVLAPCTSEATPQVYKQSNRSQKDRSQNLERRNSLLSGVQDDDGDEEPLRRDECGRDGNIRPVLGDRTEIVN